MLFAGFGYLAGCSLAGCRLAGCCSFGGWRWRNCCCCYWLGWFLGLVLGSRSLRNVLRLLGEPPSFFSFLETWVHLVSEFGACSGAGWTGLVVSVTVLGSSFVAAAGFFWGQTLAWWRTCLQCQQGRRLPSNTTIICRSLEIMVFGMAWKSPGGSSQLGNFLQCCHRRWGRRPRCHLCGTPGHCTPVHGFYGCPCTPAGAEMTWSLCSSLLI